MILVEPISRLNAGASALLRQRDHVTARDTEQFVTQFSAALIQGRIKAIQARDDLGRVRGLGAWRWQDSPRTHAQVFLLYARPNEIPEVGSALVDYLAATLPQHDKLDVIEIRYRDDPPGVRAAWEAHGAVFFERCQLVRAMGTLPLPMLPWPHDYQAIPWTDAHQADVEALAALAAERGLESVAVPDHSPARRGVMLRRLRDTSDDATITGTWMPSASFVAIDPKGQIAAYVATVTLPHMAYLADFAERPARRQPRLIEPLLLKALHACQIAGLAQVGTAITTGNPLRAYFDQLGFQVTTCGTLAIWWRDGRQHAWA